MSALPDFFGGGIFGFAGCSSGAMDDVAAAIGTLMSIEGDGALDILLRLYRGYGGIQWVVYGGPTSVVGGVGVVCCLGDLGE